MKKIAAALIGMMLAVMMVLPVGAAVPDRPDGTNELMAAWEGYEKIPDYSGGFWIGEDGALTVGLVDAAGKAEVLAIVGDAPVEFVTQAYSYNELMAVQKELESYFDKDVGLVTAGVYVMENAVQANVDTANPNAAAFMEKMTARFGDKVTFHGEDGLRVVVDTVDGSVADGPIITGTAEEPSEGAKTAPATIIGVVVLAVAAVLLSRSCRKMGTSGKKPEE